jgi:peptidoglycan L-alanyl-D-glutamate endopeptidase CwlK
MSFKLSNRSLNTLKGVHPDLIAVVKRAITITEEDFLVGCGVRTLAKQREYVLSGASKTMNSRHLVVNGYSHAVDLWLWKDGKVSWDTSNADSFYEVSHDDDYENYQEIGTSMIQAARELRIPLRWGADWDGDGQHTDHSFIDWVHFELPKDKY